MQMCLTEFYIYKKRKNFALLRNCIEFPSCIFTSALGVISEISINRDSQEFFLMRLNRLMHRQNTLMLMTTYKKNTLMLMTRYKKNTLMLMTTYKKMTFARI